MGSYRRILATTFVVPAMVALTLIVGSGVRAVQPPASVATGDPPQQIIYPPVGGMRNSGATVSNPVGTLETAILVSDTKLFRAGGLVRIDTELMRITSVDVTAIVVQRAFRTPAMGCNWCTTGPATHAIGAQVLTDYTEMRLNASAVTHLETGVTLASPIDAVTSEASSAVLGQSATAANTTLMVSDVSPLEGSATVAFEGVAHNSTTNGSFLGSTGRDTSFCGIQGASPNHVWFACTTTGDNPPNGPNGNGLLATVSLNVKPASVVNLDLFDVELAHPQPPDPQCPPEECPPLIAQEVLDGWIAVGGATAPSSSPSPTPGLISVYLQPAGQIAGLNANVNVEVRIQNVTNLGGYQFKLKWDPAPETLTTTGMRRGYLTDAGAPWDRGVTLSGAIDDTQTSMGVANASALQPGWTAMADNEEMLIASVAAPNITVVRGYRGTSAASHANGIPVYAGPERVFVTRTIGAAVPHTALAELVAPNRVIRVSNAAPLAGQNSLKIGTEQLKPAQNLARTYRSNVGTLSTGMNASATSATVPSAVTVGSVMRVDHELMAVTAKSGSSATLVRGFWGSSAVSHSPGAVIGVIGPEANSVRVARAAYGTTAAAHATNDLVYDADGLGAFAYTVGSTFPATGQFGGSQAPPTVLSSAVDGVVTTLPVSDIKAIVDNDNDGLVNEDLPDLIDNDLDLLKDEDPAFETGWTLVITSGGLREYVRLVSATGDGPGGAQDVLEVQRGYGTPAIAHSASDTVGPVILEMPWATDGGWLGSTGRTSSCVRTKAPALDSINVSCTTTGTALGPAGAGVLANTRISVSEMMPRVGARPATLSGVTLTDVTGTSIPLTATNGIVRPVRCPDFDGNGNVNSTGDFLSLANVLFKGQTALPQHDMDLNGTLNSTGDLISAAWIIFVSAPQPIRCAPLGSW
ncbi:MAG: hypothetical protein WEB52_05265 [Dehalococcoidia bacterium]